MSYESSPAVYRWRSTPINSAKGVYWTFSTDLDLVLSLKEKNIGKDSVSAGFWCFLFLSFYFFILQVIEEFLSFHISPVHVYGVSIQKLSKGTEFSWEVFFIFFFSIFSFSLFLFFFPSKTWNMFTVLENKIPFFFPTSQDHGITLSQKWAWVANISTDPKSQISGFFFFLLDVLFYPFFSYRCQIRMEIFPEILTIMQS